MHKAHLKIYSPIASRDPAASAAAMNDHYQELRQYAERKFPDVLNAPFMWGPA